MTIYFLRRFLLIIPTFLGITVLTFFIMQLVPGGPLEQELLNLQMGLMSSGETAGGAGDAVGRIDIPVEALDEMKRFYGFDKPIPVRYLRWMGLWPREMDAIDIPPDTWKKVQKGVRVRAIDPDDDGTYALEYDFDELESKWEVAAVLPPATAGGDSTVVLAWLKYASRWVRSMEDSTAVTPGRWVALPENVRARVEHDPAAGWQVELDTSGVVDHWQVTGVREPDDDHPEPTVTVAWTRFSGVLTGNLGRSYVYAEPVVDVIKSRFPISIYFGLIGFLLSYTVCIPLGVFKAIKHGSKFDFVTSTIVFIGYSIPGWAFGAVLLVLFGGGSFFNVFPLGGFRSPNWEELTWIQKVGDQVYHTILPVLSYAIYSFATLTIVMKNSLLENLGQDYVRTAFAKGLAEKKVVFVHAFRNSLIPIATGLGHLLGIIVAGSYLIERVFNINGFGLLGFTSIVKRDYPVVLGILMLVAMLRLVGNIFSDMLYAVIDPRIRFK
ncbi:MAG: ABC transporter permease subunit [Candidatus Eiseniibacteriota bacterium]|jgi:microcin C transport system permease protein